jgi:trans-aconitate methyltransferase
MILVCELFLFSCALLILLLVVVYSWITGISPVPTSPFVRASLIALVSSEQRGVICDLGSGWGTLIFALAKHCPHARVMGFEMSPVPWLFSRLRAVFCRRTNLQINYANFLKRDLSDASLILCYLYPGGMKLLDPKFRAELRPGTLIISHTFALPSWTPKEIYQLSDLYRTRIYLYELE